MGLAETLSALVLGYAVDEEAMVSIDICPSLADMTSGNFPYAGADRIPLVAAATQMITEFYGRPGGCHGCKTDSAYPGVQTGVEKALSMLLPVLCGSVGVGTCGQYGALVFSPLQLVIDNEIAGYVKRILDGFEVTDETLALDVIKEVGPGGNFLAHPHTAENFRKEFWLTGLMERMPYAVWEAQETKGFEEKCRARAREILATHNPEILDPETADRIDALVEEGVAKNREASRGRRGRGG